MKKKISSQEILIDIFFKDQDFRKKETEFTEGAILLLSSVIYWKGMKMMEADFSERYEAKGKEAMGKVARKNLIRC